MRKLASIRKVNGLRPIPDADAIEVAEIGGWDVVVKKGEFSPGDLGVYFEIDSLIPITPWSEFLAKSCKKTIAGVDWCRLKTVKLRGQVSQGLLMPLTILDGGTDLLPGTDVTELLGVHKYVRPIPMEMAGEAETDFPSFVPKTDEERVQNLTDDWARMVAGRTFSKTEKLDGTSFTCFYNPGYEHGDFGVCTRTWQIRRTDAHTFWRVAMDLRLEEKLRQHGVPLAVQGELIGEGIQKNVYKLSGQHLRVFNVYDIQKQRYLPQDEAFELMRSMDVPVVPVLDPSASLEGVSVKDVLDDAEGPSVLRKEASREGVVYRSNTDGVHFKAISNKFLLKNE